MEIHHQHCNNTRNEAKMEIISKQQTVTTINTFNLFSFFKASFFECNFFRGFTEVKLYKNQTRYWNQLVFKGQY